MGRVKYCAKGTFYFKVYGVALGSYPWAALVGMEEVLNNSGQGRTRYLSVLVPGERESRTRAASSSAEMDNIQFVAQVHTKQTVATSCTLAVHNKIDAPRTMYCE